MFVFMLQTAMAAAVAWPPVCIMMPTNGRPEFVAHALATLGSQDYPARLEVVVVDDSPPELQASNESSNDLATTSHVCSSSLSSAHTARAPARGTKTSGRRQRLPTQHAIGTKRNMAAAACSADIVVHWDDDDFYGQHRLREQVRPIARGEADVTVFDHKYTYFMKRDVAYEVDEAVLPSWGPHFGTLVWRRRLFTDGVRFPNTSRAEDYGFAQLAVRAGARLQLVDSASEHGAKHFVCVRHTQNTWTWSERDYQERFWYNARTVPPASLLSAADVAFAAALRSSGVLARLPSRRVHAPSPHTEMDERIDPHFFAALYRVGEAYSRPLLDGGDSDVPGAHNSSLPTIGYHGSTYDLQTEHVMPDQSGGLVGNASTGKAAHGGIYVANNSVYLAKDLALVYYTTLRIHGDLITNGHALNLSAFASLEVTGNLVGGVLKMGSFATIDIGGNASFRFSPDGFDNTGGGNCDARASCDPAFFNRTIGVFGYKAYPAYIVTGGDLVLTQSSLTARTLHPLPPPHHSGCSEWHCSH
jgi:glycosyltransferase involved in cell wall biosynthesis